MVALSDAPAAAADDRAGFDRMAALIRHLAGWLAPRKDRLQVSYLIPERSGYGWYVIAREPAFDFALNDELAVMGVALARAGFPVHAALLPGSVPPTVPTDGIAIIPGGGATVYAD